MSLHRSRRLGAAIAALAIVLTFASGATEARPGGGFSFGSRGARTFSPPPITNTAPRTAAPLGRQNAGGPLSYAPQPSRSGGFLSGGFGRGLVGGFLGAGLFGLLAGQGFFGGLGDGLSFLGLIIQVGILVLLIRFAIGLFRGRQQAAYGGSGGGGFSTPGTFGAQNRVNPAQRTQTTPLQLANSDFEVFQQRLGEIHGAYSAEDVATLRRVATPEMASQFAGELSEHQRRGVVNRLSGVSLLQGDLSEAWREDAREYATVAMRYTIVDVMVDRSNGRIVSGDPSRPDQVTELWTFVRPAGNGANAWTLSAIQQT